MSQSEESTPEPIQSCPICKTSTIQYIRPSTAVSTHLDHFVRDTINAVNSRDFSVYSKGWSYFTPGLKVDSAQPIYEWPKCIGSNVGLKRHLKGLRYISSTHAGFHLRLVDIDTQIDEKLGSAVVYANVETTGIPTSLTIQGVIVFEFRMIGEEWKCVKFAGARGIF